MTRRKPEKAVPELLAQLIKAKEWALNKYNNNNNNSLSSRFKNIEVKLQGMTDSYSRIKDLETRVTMQFCVLEQSLKHTFEEHLSEEGLLEKLARIETELVELEEMISTIDSRVTDKLRTTSFEPAYTAHTEDGYDEPMSRNWKNLGIEDKIFESEVVSNLLASFHRLESTQAKKGLMFLSVFPENSVIKKKPFIYWWIGEGIVEKRENETAEEVGERVFQQLLIKGFIKTSDDDNNFSTVKSFIVHPWIRHMVIVAAQKNNLLTFSSDHAPRTDSQRAFPRGGNLDLEGEKEENLLTVFNLNEQYLQIKSAWLWKLKKVRVLHLGSWRSGTKHHIEFGFQEVLANGLGSQKDLKYLSLRGISGVDTLPDSIVKLTTLEILDLKACQSLAKLPRDISTLENLTRLDVSECYLLESFPKGLGKLRALQVLKGFVIGKEWQSSCRIKDLSTLENMRKLSVRVDSNDAQAQDQLSELNFPALHILTISWGVLSPRPPPSFPFSFLGSLRKLDLRCAPKWMLPRNLPNLEKLYITGGYINNDLETTFEGLKTVKFLRFKYLKSLKIDEDVLVSSFPNYRHLKIINCGDPPRNFDRKNPTVSDQGPSF